MRKILIAIAILSIVVLKSTAADLDACLHYLYQDAPAGSWMLQDDGNGAYIRTWNLKDKQPTLRQLGAVADVAEPWWQEKVKQLKVEQAMADSPELAAVVSSLLDEVNTLRATLNLPVKSMEDVTSAASDKLSE